MEKKPPEVVESDFDYYFQRYCEFNGLSEEAFKGKPNIFLNALKDIGDHIFEPLTKTQAEERSERELRMAFKWYVGKCQKFEFTPTMGNYAVLIRASSMAIRDWLTGKSRANSYYQDCMIEFSSYCETCMSNATLSEEVPVVSGIFHLKAVHGWSDQPEQKPVEVVHTVAALSDIASRYNIAVDDFDKLPDSGQKRKEKKS